MDLDDYTAFERFVSLTDFIFVFFNAYPYFSVIASGGVVLANWLIFRHHLMYYDTYDFFLKNIKITGRFCGPTFEMWKWVGMTILPAGIGIIVFSGLTGFRTRPFLAVFAIKGTGRYKRYLIKKAIKFKEQQNE